MSNKEPQNYEGGHFDIRYSMFDILRFRKNTYKTNSCDIAAVSSMYKDQLLKRGAYEEIWHFSFRH